ncbi:metallophosphoesterase [Shouchella patagoniensis]|uniref:metallophosphoesterase n=1 Tax=Shouchella patagoniensis TaxID=228576 RepID=UPI001FE71486|nr:metallophosphoesterase [Shouchella patagoniensis]
MKILIGLLLCMVFVIGGIYLYARFIEPKRLDITSHHISSESIGEELDGFKIIQFSDTHIGEDYSIEQLDELVQRINEVEPDLIVFTGDLIEDSSDFDKEDKVAESLSRLQAPYGTYAISGNREVGGAGISPYEGILAKAGINFLRNESITIDVNGESLVIVGLDDYMLGEPQPESAFAGVAAEDFTVTLVHEPDVVEDLKSYPFDLQLSGHSHGGQVRLPIIGDLYTPPLAEKYPVGRYEIEGGIKPITLYVNRGIGMARVPYRFLSIPEVSVFTLESEQD